MLRYKISWCLLSAALLTTATAVAQNVKTGDPAPNFTLNKFGGGTVSTTGFPGKTLFLNFFGSY